MTISLTIISTSLKYFFGIKSTNDLFMFLIKYFDENLPLPGNNYQKVNFGPYILITNSNIQG